MKIRVLIGFFAGAALASLGSYWLTHRQPASPTVVEAPTTPPAVEPPVGSTPAEPPPLPAPEPVPPKATARKHEKARPRLAPRPPVIAHHLPPFNDHPVQAPVPAIPPTVEIASSPPVVEAQAPVPVAPDPATEPKTPEPLQPNTVTIAAGTLIPVRIGEMLSTKKNRPGDSFTGALDHELVVDGFVIAERGARVEGRVAVVEEAGRLRGLSHLAVELTRLHTSDGQTVAIRTAQFEKLGPQSRREDAEKIGAGTVLGAVIGAAAGGGKGAAIGAGAGAAAGAGTVAATPGKPAEIPVETVVSFKLDQPVAITEKLQ